MKAGTVVKLPDGRIGTVVYNGLDGVGIKWGEHKITMDDILGSGGMIRENIPDEYQWKAEAMLREPCKYVDLPCVGKDYEVIS